MESYTLKHKIQDVFLYPLKKLEWYFAKRWLDKNFGKQEYWGQYIMELILLEQRVMIIGKNTFVSDMESVQSRAPDLYGIHKNELSHKILQKLIDDGYIVFEQEYVTGKTGRSIKAWIRVIKP